MTRAWLVVSVAALAGACHEDTTTTTRAEDARVVMLIRQVREAPNPDKSEPLGALAGAPCHRPEVCALQLRCVAAYRAFERGRAVTGDATPTAAELSRAAQELAEARTLMLECAEHEARVAPGLGQ